MFRMCTRFASLHDFFAAVRSETRHYRYVTDEVLSWPITEYQLWLDDSTPDKKPLEVELRGFLEKCARWYRWLKPAKPRAHWEPPGEPPEWQQESFKLFGIDWRPI